MKVLRQGTNDFTCMPGDPTGVGMPAMCADKVAMQWNSDFADHKERPSTTVPGISSSSSLRNARLPIFCSPTSARKGLFRVRVGIATYLPIL